MPTPVRRLRVVLIKPTKYARDGAAERFSVGFMPNATLHHVASMTPARIAGLATVVETVDEYVASDLDYLDNLRATPATTTLLALVGVQSHQFQRALDLAALARQRGVEHCVIGGPHAMTCDTTLLHGRGVAFALAEAELVWPQILADAAAGSLAPVYGAGRRWTEHLPGTVIRPPPAAALERYWMPMLGIYPVRGCPYRCNFCSVIHIAGNRLRAEPIETTMRSLRAAREAGVETVIFTSDNFNQFPDVETLLDRMIEEAIGLRFFCQCDTRVARRPALIERLGRAGCFQIFVGVESFDRATLKTANKYHNHPREYAEIVRRCREAGVQSHFSNIIGFPGQHRADIESHLETLIELAPDVASFYLLTPIPGTEQYREFRAAGLIEETNLDRFDATSMTWRHPHLAAEELGALLFECYQRFYREVLRRPGLAYPDRRFAQFCRLTASRGQHPMAGGMGPVELDHASDYAALRRQCFGIDQVPLPDNLAVPEALASTEAR